MDLARGLGGYETVCALCRGRHGCHARLSVRGPRPCRTHLYNPSRRHFCNPCRRHWPVLSWVRTLTAAFVSEAGPQEAGPLTAVCAGLSAHGLRPCRRPVRIFHHARPCRRPVQSVSEALLQQSVAASVSEAGPYLSSCTFVSEAGPPSDAHAIPMSVSGDYLRIGYLPGLQATICASGISRVAYLRACRPCSPAAPRASR